MKKFLYVFLFSCIFSTLSSKIIEIPHFQELEKDLYPINETTLVLFDIDWTLIVPEDRILCPSYQKTLNSLFEKALNSKCKFTKDFLKSKILLQAKSRLSDQKLPTTIQKLQNQGATVLALTGIKTDCFGAIPSLADWRITQLERVGIKLSQYDAPELIFSEFDKTGAFPLFKRGILFSSWNSKGEVLLAYLKKTGFRPKKVIFVEDCLEYLESVEGALKGTHIEFIGFHYIGASTCSVPLDENLAKFQIDYLVEHGEWLSDQEAKILKEQ